MSLQIQRVKFANSVHIGAEVPSVKCEHQKIECVQFGGKMWFQITDPRYPKNVALVGPENVPYLNINERLPAVDPLTGKPLAEAVIASVKMPKVEKPELDEEPVQDAPKRGRKPKKVTVDFDDED